MKASQDKAEFITIIVKNQKASLVLSAKFKKEEITELQVLFGHNKYATKEGAYYSVPLATISSPWLKQHGHHLRFSARHARKVLRKYGHE